MLGWVGLDCAGLGWAVLGWVVMGWAGLGRDVLGCAGMGWAGLGRACSVEKMSCMSSEAVAIWA